MMNTMTKETLTNMTMTELNKELKRVASLKCNLKKRKNVADKAAALTDILSYEDLIKEVKYSLQNKGKTYFAFSHEDIDALNIEELIKFRKGVASKKCLDGNDADILATCEDLLAYSKQVLDAKRLEQNETVITKAELRTLLDNFDQAQDINLLLTSLRELAE